LIRGESFPKMKDTSIERSESMSQRRGTAVIFLIIFSLPFTLRAQTDLLPPAGFMPDWVKHEKVQRFEKGGLFGYINGAAELFLEFGFEELLVQNYRSPEDELGLEIYRMESQDAALGLYLMKCGREKPPSGLPYRHTGDRYQFIITKSNFFLLINNFKGKEILVPAMEELARQTLDNLPGTESSHLLSLLPETGRIPGSERIFRGPYSLEPIYAFGEGDILNLKGRIFGVSADYTGQEKKTFTRIIVLYPDENQASDTYSHLLSRLDASIQILTQSENNFSFKDYHNRFGSVLVEKNILDIRVNLDDPPKIKLELPAAGHR
jgi:hypothetical protein